MPYTARVLPVKEWPKLATTPLAADWLPALDPNHTVVVVVEDGEQIVASWLALTTVHVEGLNIDPAHQKRGVVGGLLLRTMIETLQAQQVPEVLTQAASEDIETLLQKVHATPLPGITYRIPIPQGVS